MRLPAARTKRHLHSFVHCSCAIFVSAFCKFLCFVVILVLCASNVISSLWRVIHFLMSYVRQESVEDNEFDVQMSG